MYSPLISDPEIEMDSLTNISFFFELISKNDKKAWKIVSQRSSIFFEANFLF